MQVRSQTIETLSNVLSAPTDALTSVGETTNTGSRYGIHSTLVGCVYLYQCTLTYTYSSLNTSGANAVRDRQDDTCYIVFLL